MRSTVETVTPEKARAILDSCRNRNRPISKKLVAKLAREMQDGKWMENGESIVFNDNGDLLDGQHRLSAICLSGVPCRMVVAKGVDHEAFRTIDRGKKRSPRDDLFILGYKNANNLASACNYLGWYKEYADFPESDRIHRKVYIGGDYVERVLEENPGLPDSVNFIMNHRSSVYAQPVAVAIVIHYILGEHNGELRDEFYDRVWNRKYDDYDCAIRALASVYDSSHQKALVAKNMRAHVYFWLKSFNMYCGAEKYKPLRYAASHDLPAPVSTRLARRGLD